VGKFEERHRLYLFVALIVPKLLDKLLIELLVRRQLQKAGFTVARVKGSHHILIHPDGRRTVVPVHSGEAQKGGKDD
jgi:HicA toxin of bacterial toxin-antitoxin,